MPACGAACARQDDIQPFHQGTRCLRRIFRNKRYDMPEHSQTDPISDNQSSEPSLTNQPQDVDKTAAMTPDEQAGDPSPAQEAAASSTPSAESAAPAEQDGTELDITHPDDALEPIQMDQLPPAMQEACARAGWTTLMPVQSTALPYLMDGRDIMIQSRTGSGKTGTYLLPLVPSLRPDKKVVQALVLVPTRELASQVTQEAEVLFAGTGITPAALYGGVGYQKQLKQLKEGAQLVIGTPGRVLDHLLRRTLSLDTLRALVFDEADRMLSIGFYPDMKEIQRYLPQKRIYTSLLSATFPPHVLNLAAEFMTTPAMLSLSQKQVYAAQVEHCFVRVSRMDKDRALIRLLEIENPASAIIFCNTKANVHYIAGVLQGFGYNADELSADLTQNKREEVMRKVKEGKTRLLVATDVAARGIDIHDLSHVFLYEPPEDSESYIHRSGRTGRANAAGTVISLVDIMEFMELERIAKLYHLSLHEIPNPTDEDVAKVVSSRLVTMLEARYRSLNALVKTRLLRYTELAKELASLSAEDANEGTGINLLAMLLDACHHNTLEDICLPKPSFSRKERRRGDNGGNGGGGRKSGRSDRHREHAQAEDGAQVTSDMAPADGPQADEAAGQEPAPRHRRRRKRSSGRGSRQAADSTVQAEQGDQIPSADAAEPAAQELPQDNAGAAADGAKAKSSHRRRRRPRAAAAAETESAEQVMSEPGDE